MPTLYVVATPIGNLSDASPRMVETLRSVALICAEDTRVTGNLLRHFGVETKMVSLHRHNEADKAEPIVRRMLDDGIDVALVTDAGTPAISDPGHLLVRAAAEAGIEAVAVAGPSAMAAALSVSGLDAREFAFYGFLPREKGDLKKKLLQIAKGPAVAVLHESPHRVVDLIETVAETLPGCVAVCCCDLTKRYEATLRGPVDAVLAALKANPKVEKGEYCVVLDFSLARLPEEKPVPSASAEARIVDAMLGGLSLREAVEAIATQGVKKNDAKRAGLKVREWLESERQNDAEAL